MSGPNRINKLPTQPRTCLMCGKLFPSTGPGNRRCQKCKNDLNGVKEEKPRLKAHNGRVVHNPI